MRELLPFVVLDFEKKKVVLLKSFECLIKIVLFGKKTGQLSSIILTLMVNFTHTFYSLV